MSDPLPGCDRCGASPVLSYGYCVIGPLTLRELRFCGDCAKQPSVSPEPSGSFAGMWPVDFGVLERCLAEAAQDASIREYGGDLAKHVAQVIEHFHQRPSAPVQRWLLSGGEEWPKRTT